MCTGGEQQQQQKQRRPEVAGATALTASDFGCGRLQGGADVDIDIQILQHKGNRVVAPHKAQSLPHREAACGMAWHATGGLGAL